MNLQGGSKVGQGVLTFKKPRFSVVFWMDQNLSLFDQL